MVRHPTIPSVKLVGVGMLHGTNHDHMDATWRATRFEGETPPPTDGYPDELRDMADRLDAIADAWPTNGAQPSKITIHYPDGTMQEVTL